MEIQREKPGPKLSTEKQIEFVQRIAWFWKPLDILKYFKETHNIKINQTLIQCYKNSEKWKPIIQKFRDDYLKRTEEVPLANKRKRLDELQRLFDRAVDKKEFVEAKNIIREFREEMEVKVGDVNFSFTQINHNEFHDMSDEDLASEKAKTIEQLEKVRKMKMLSDQRGDKK